MAARKINIDVSKYKRQSGKREKRKIRFSVLIVCEGEATEPNYFKALAKRQQGIMVYELTVKGLGRATTNVVEEAVRLKKKNNYDRVWAVFDRDEFPAKDFNAAIAMGNSNGIEVAWSNEAFELWYLYHFNDVTTGMSRKQYEEKISTAVKRVSGKHKSEGYKYSKNDPKNYEIVTALGSMDAAIKRAEARHKEYIGTDYADQNPCTTVYRLVRQLIGEDKDFNDELIEKTEGISSEIYVTM